MALGRRRAARRSMRWGALMLSRRCGVCSEAEQGSRPEQRGGVGSICAAEQEGSPGPG